MVACAKTVNRNKEGILNSYRYGKTNAVAEGVSNPVKAAKRRGYGIRRLSAFRRRVLIALGLGHAEVVRPALRDASAEEGA